VPGIVGAGYGLSVGSGVTGVGGGGIGVRVAGGVADGTASVSEPTNRRAGRDGHAQAVPGWRRARVAGVRV